MKSLGVVRRVDELGRLVMPKELRNVLDISSGTPLEIFVEGETIVLKKYEPGCIFCGYTDVKIYENKKICKKCINNLQTI